nr:PREDICTED: transmembrane protein 182-like isoform X2 [Lepisosteus oculatus]
MGCCSVIDHYFQPFSQKTVLQRTQTPTPNTNNEVTQTQHKHLASWNSSTTQAENRTVTEKVTTTGTDTVSALIFHHEGFFWRCWFREDSSWHTFWAFLFTNQPPHKFCVHGYLFPLPIAIGPVPHPSYDATAGSLFLVLLSLFALWKELVADVPRYILLERSEGCPAARVIAHYGWSFLFAAAGIPLVLLAGLLFFFIGRHIQRNQ